MKRMVSAGITALLYAPLAYAQTQEPGSSPEDIFESEIEAAQELITEVMNFCVNYSFQIVGGMLILLLGWFAASMFANGLRKMLLKKNVDVTVTKFIAQSLKLCIVGFAIIIALGKFGITIAPFIAGLSVIGFGTSFALQGPLSNYAAGMTLIFTKPFKVGDIISVIDVDGEVIDIQLARSELKTVDGNRIIIPNKHIIGEVIHNYAGKKRVDITVGIAYEADVDKAIAVVKNILSEDSRIAQNPPPKVGISEFADSSINIYARARCPLNDYWDVLFDINKRINEEFGKANITIPFPQRDIHIINQS